MHSALAVEPPPRARAARHLPLDEALPSEAPSIAELAMELLRARRRGGLEFDSAMERYREAVFRLAEEVQGLDLRQVERMALPEELRNPTIRFAGLPEAKLPFSPLGGWVNERLEAALEAEVPPNGKRTTYTRLISRILDRYVESFFPTEHIPEFYRPSVLALHSVPSSDIAYELEVIGYARGLADLALLSLPSENTNLLKPSEHKSIPIQTGVQLTEQSSSSARQEPQKAPFDYGRRHIRPSLAGRLGLLKTSDNLSPLHGARLGLPGFDRLLAQQKAKELPSRDELASQLSFVIRSGKPARHSHPDLAGMEFSPEQCDDAAALAIAAQRKLAGDDSGLGGLSQEALNAALLISATRPFREACESRDRRAQMRIALEAYVLEMRAKEIAERFGVVEAGEQAKKDLDMARDFVEEYRSPPADGNIVLRSVRRMEQLAKTVECLDLSDFEIALRVVDERHMKQEPSSTIRPPADSAVPPAPGEAAIPLPAPLPKDLQPPADAEESPAEAEPPDGVDIDVEGLGVAEGGAAEEQAEPTEPVPVAQAAQEAEAASEAPEAAAQDAEPAPAEPKEEAARIYPEPEEAGVPAAPEAALPKFDFDFPNTVFDTELEPLLPPKEGPRNILIRRVARALVYYKLTDYDDAAIDPRCLGAVKLLKADYSPQAALDFAIEIVDGPFAPPKHPAEPAPALARPSSEILGRIDDDGKELVARVMAVPVFDEQALAGFMAMAPANRELAMQRVIARQWIDGDFRTDLSRMRGAREKLCSACGLARPTPMEKLAAIMEPANLSDEQRFMAGYLFHTSGPITPKHIEALGVWVSSDPSTEAGRTRLTEYWNQVLVSSAQNSFNITSGVWLNTPLADRRRIWHCASDDVLSAGSLAHKLRFSPGERFSFDEAALVSQIYGKSWDEVWTLGDQAKGGLSMALTQHTYKNGSASMYYPEILALAKMPYAFVVPAPGKPAGANPLHYSAMREMEFNTMMDFLGIPIESAVGSLNLAHGTSRAKAGNGNGPKPNEDSWSGARVRLSDGSVISLDMVADGMGGHNQGSNGGKTNGQAASGMAREIFEIAAVAGWIREPEDVRRMILVADLAIVLEQIRKKALGAAVRDVTKEWEKSGVDVASMNPAWLPQFNSQVAAKFAEHMRSADAMQTNNMGTTMTVAFQRGKKLWFIHCGDSDGKLMRGEKIIFNTEGHSAEYELRLAAKAAARDELREAYLSRGVDPDSLEGEGLAQFEQEAEALFEERIEPMKEFFANNKNVVCSVLGVSPKYIFINNAEDSAEPLETEDTDLVWVSSDGITVPVCDHELPAVIYGNCTGDLEAAREMLISMAEARRSSNPNPTICECKERPGKNDDKTLTLRYAAEAEGPIFAHDGGAVPGGPHFGWLCRQVAGNPTGLALSKTLRLVLDGCAGPQFPRERLLHVFDSMISAAESTPPGKSTGAYSLALSAIFMTVSRRPDREELLNDLAPRLGSWSGLMLKKLRDSPDASERKRAMFDFVAANVPAEALEGLLNARNSEVISWAEDALGMELPVDGKQVIYASSGAPRPEFDSQTDIDGSPLDIWSTRYLDTKVVEIFGSTVVQDTAKKLGVLPRDLEIMVFYAYSDFQPNMAVDPHMSVEGQNLIASVGDHLCTGDAESILVSSYLLYKLKDTAPKKSEAKRMALELWRAVKAMDVGAPYALMFFNKAYGFQEPTA